MRKINKPQLSQIDICNSIKNFKYSDRVLSKIEDYDEDYKDVRSLIEDEKQYISSDKDYKLYMKKVYKTLSNKGYVNSYKYYKEIRDSEKKCPYCNYITRSVEELDHYLPKSTFPVHSITVNNLVPICSECNDKKGTYYSENEEQTLLHPYYDDIMSDAFNFIKCEVIEDFNIGFKFYIQKLTTWDDVLYSRVKKHFELLEIDDLYRSDFEADFIIFLDELLIFFKDNKVNKIDDFSIFIDRKIESIYRSKIKPWSYAGFKSIRNNKWFIEEFLSNKIETK